MKLGIVGAGVMGVAIGQAVQRSGLVTPGQMWATTKTESSAERAASALGCPTSTVLDPELVEATDVVLLGVKPKIARTALADLKEAGLRRDALVLSVVTGLWTRNIHEVTGAEQPVIRVMTNTPCLVGEGVAALCVGKGCSADHRKLAREMFEPIASVFEADEQHCDALTGLCGSGPAYIYLMMEALADGGVQVGLPREMALHAAAQTMLGAAKMVLASGRHPATLKDDVTTPAGCTIAALLVMEDGRIRSTLARAVEEATRTASGLARPSEPPK